MAVAIVLVVAAPGSAPVSASTHKNAAFKAATSPHVQREVFGFALASSLADPTIGYPSWNFDLLSTVAFFGVHVGSAGGFVGDAGWSTWNSSTLTNLVSVAHQHGTKVVLTVILQDFSPNTPDMCAGLHHADATVAQTLSEVKAKGVDGVNIDYEGLDGSCGSSDPYWAQHAFTTFAQKMRAGLGSSYYLSVDTYASSASDGYGFFDVAGLSAYVDSFFVMAYDLEYSNYSRFPTSCSSFCLGPTSPLTGYYYTDSGVMSEYSAVVGAGKVIFGVPYYGRKSCVGSAIANAYPTSSVSADSYLDATGEAAYSAVQAGSYAAHRDANSTGLERWDTWYNTSLGCTRELYWDDATSLGKKYDLVNSAKLRGTGMWTLNYGGGASELWSALANHFSGCTGVSLTATPASPQVNGSAITFSASAAGCQHPLYQFWVLAPGASWQIVQPYSSTATFSWNTSGLSPGSYLYTVWARDSGSSGTGCNSLGCFDTYFTATAYKLISRCTSVSESAAPSPPRLSGTAVTFSATSTGCPHALYQFWVLAPGSHTWQITQPYSSSATLNWNTSGLGAGGYLYTVWVRDASGSGTSCNSLGCFDTYSPATTYTLASPCSAATDSAAPGSPQLSGTAITFSAGASGCPHPLYQFWVLAPGSSIWKVGQAYSTSATFAWNTTGLPGGTYLYTVWVRDSASPGTSCNSLGCFDTYFPASSYALRSPCGSVTEAAAPASTAPRGTSITFSATASGCSRPLYQFWILAPGSHTWQIGQAYSSSATFTWNTTGLAAGGYVYTVWVRDASSTGTSSNSLGSFDSYSPATGYTLT
jgi:spore germination protein YaaH